MRITSLILTIILAVGSFITTANKQSKEYPTIDKLTKISLPFSSSCGAILKVYENVIIKSFISDPPPNLKFGGLLKITENFAAIILVDTYADSQIHYLTTITTQGKIIDKFKLFSSDCSEDELFCSKAKYTIDKELKIIQTDSYSTYKRNKNGEIIKKTIVKSTHKFEFYIDKNGNVKKYGI